MILFGVWIFYLLLNRVIGDKNGVSVTVMGANVDDDGFVDFNERALANWKVLCHTDNQSCCNKTPRLGEWFYPDGSKVMSFSDIGGETALASYVRDRGAGFVRLYRRYRDTTLPSERGRFSCVIPNAQGINQTYYVNILDIDRVTITPHNPRAVVGQSYNATCSVRITTNPLPVNTPTPTFKWFYGPNKSMLITNGSNGTVSVQNISNRYVSTIDLTPFSVSHAGIYTCQFGGNEGLNASIIITANVYAGVYTQLRDTVYSNNSNIIINDIGEGTNSLICFTDLVDCCTFDQSLNGQALGNWFYPNGSTVGIKSDNTRGFYKNRDTSRVRLNRRETTTSPLGLFCCEVPDSTYNVIRVCANIVSEFPSVTTTAPTIPSVSEHTSNTIMVTSTSEYATTVPTTPSEHKLTFTTGTATTMPLEKVEEEEQDQTEEEQDQTEVGNTSMGINVAVVVTTVVILFTVIFATTLVVICLVRKRAKYRRSTQHTFQMSIRETLQINIISPHDVIVTEGEGVYFKVKVSGVPQPTVTWYHNGETVKADYAREIEEDGSLAISSTELKHSGVYKAVVSNQHGSEEREVKLTVDKNGKADTADHTYETADSVNNHYEIIKKGTNQQLPSGDYQMTQCPVYGMHGTVA